MSGGGCGRDGHDGRTGLDRRDPGDGRGGLDGRSAGGDPAQVRDRRGSESGDAAAATDTESEDADVTRRPGPDVPDWPPLVHAAGCDRATLLRRIVGG
jgi:hypothetical protein